MITGPDISSYQPSWQPRPTDAFVFIKSSEGTGHKSRTVDRHAGVAHDHGLVVGYYHCLTPGSVAAQVAYMAKCIPTATPQMVAADWERFSAGFASEADLHEWVRLTKQKYPHSKVGIYCSASPYAGMRDRDSGDFAWIAKWSSTPPEGYGRGRVLFWQYQGDPHPIDYNQGAFASAEALRGWLGEQTHQPQPPGVRPTTGLVVDPAHIEAASLHHRGKASPWTTEVRAVKRALGKALGTPLPDDGIFGRGADEATRTWQAHLGHRVDPIGHAFPGPTELAALSRAVGHPFTVKGV